MSVSDQHPCELAFRERGRVLLPVPAGDEAPGTPRVRCRASPARCNRLKGGRGGNAACGFDGITSREADDEGPRGRVGRKGVCQGGEPKHSGEGAGLDGVDRAGDGAGGDGPALGCDGGADASCPPVAHAPHPPTPSTPSGPASGRRFAPWRNAIGCPRHTEGRGHGPGGGGAGIEEKRRGKRGMRRPRGGHRACRASTRIC